MPRLYYEPVVMDHLERIHKLLNLVDEKCGEVLKTDPKIEHKKLLTGIRFNTIAVRFLLFGAGSGKTGRKGKHSQ